MPTPTFHFAPAVCLDCWLTFDAATQRAINNGRTPCPFCGSTRHELDIRTERSAAA